MSGYGLVCGHCRSKVRIRTSSGEHVHLRTAYLQCTNEACGATYRAVFEVTHTLSPSSMPNPSMDLPLAPAAMRREAMKTLMGDAESKQADLIDAILDAEENDQQQAGIRHGVAQ